MLDDRRLALKKVQVAYSFQIFSQRTASEKVDRYKASIYNQADTNQIEICLLWSYKARLEVKKFINLGMKEFPAIDTTEE